MRILRALYINCKEENWNAKFTWGISQKLTIRIKFFRNIFSSSSTFQLLSVCAYVGCTTLNFFWRQSQNQAELTQPQAPNEDPLILMRPHLQGRVDGGGAPHLELMSCYWCIISSRRGSRQHTRYPSYAFRLSSLSCRLFGTNVYDMARHPRCVQMTGTQSRTDFSM